MEGDVTADAGAGTLYIVSTPIGNMGDFSFRAVEVLKSVTLVLAEDTRHTRHLLDHYGVQTVMKPYHEHNEARATPELIDRLRAGASLALVSDAGTPLLSDPGARLVHAAIEAGIDVVPLPGASALLAALVASGLDVGRFTFHGFLERSGRVRRQALEEILSARHTSVLFESPGRLVATLGELEKRGGGDRSAAVAREMTKQFEEVRRGTVSELRAYYGGTPPKGEIVIVIAAAPARAASNELVRERVRALRRSGVSARDAATSVARELGVARRVAYKLAQEES